MRWRGVAIWVAVMALLGACSRSDKASTLPAPPTVTASASASESSYPATSVGAADFVRHYYDVVNAAFRSGDTKVLRGLSAASCQSCTTLANAAESVHRQGRRVVGSSYSIDFAVAPAESPQRTTVNVGYSVSAGQLLDQDGHVLDTSAPISAGQEDVTVMRRDNGWVVTEILKLNPK